MSRPSPCPIQGPLRGSGTCHWEQGTPSPQPQPLLVAPLSPLSHSSHLLLVLSSWFHSPPTPNTANPPSGDKRFGTVLWLDSSTRSGMILSLPWGCFHAGHHHVTGAGSPPTPTPRLTFTVHPCLPHPSLPTSLTQRRHSVQKHEVTSPEHSKVGSSIFTLSEF